MESVGFVYLDNVPGYNKEVEAQLHEAATCFFFFSQSLWKKGCCVTQELEQRLPWSVQRVCPY